MVTQQTSLTTKQPAIKLTCVMNFVTGIFGGKMDFFFIIYSTQYFITVCRNIKE